MGLQRRRDSTRSHITGIMRLYSTVIPAVTLGQLDLRSGSSLPTSAFDGGHLCDSIGEVTFENFCHNPVTDTCECPPNTVMNTTPLVKSCSFVNGCNPDANDQCNANAQCSNKSITDMILANNVCADESILAYSCECNPGYAGDGFDFGTSCTDYNECVY